MNKLTVLLTIIALILTIGGTTKFSTDGVYKSNQFIGPPWSPWYTNNNNVVSPVNDISAI